MQSIPALVQVAVVFVLVVIASARKIHLGLAAALGGFVLALWRGMLPLAAVRTAFAEVINPDTVLLVLLMACIMAFSTAMKKSGAMAAFSSSLAALAPSPRIAMALAPMLIGTLPVPGGAILSAPLVDAMDPERTRSAAVLAAANYWFRHSLELAWPLYPAFILTSSLTGLSAGRLMALNFYAMPVLLTAGLLFILPPLRLVSAAVPGPRVAFGPRLRAFASGFAPLALVLGTYILLDRLWSTVSPSLGLAPALSALISRFGPIYMGIAVGSLKVALSPTGSGAFRNSIGLATLKLIAVIVGIRVFSVLLGAVGIADAVSGELAAAGIPTLVAVAVLPLVAGLITGVGFGYVGLAFPIVLGLVPAGGSFPREAAVVLGGAFGYAGMMLSPLHVCMVVTSEHFGVGLAATIRRFALPLGVFVAVAMGYVSLLAFVLV